MIYDSQTEIVQQNLLHVHSPYINVILSYSFLYQYNLPLLDTVATINTHFITRGYGGLHQWLYPEHCRSHTGLLLLPEHFRLPKVPFW